MQLNFSKFLSASLLLIPPAFLLVWFLARFPSPPGAVQVYPSLASLPSEARSWTVYPENIYEGGSYATFPYGKVRYWILGPEDGEKLVLINGLSIPAIIWKGVAPALAEKGFRVLVYDLYGRGYSDAPQRPYDTSLYITQLALLMQHLKWENANIAGLSMGGGIAAAFAATFPSLSTGKIALIASVGIMESEDLSRTSKVMSYPLIQSIASSSLVRWYLQRLLKEQSTVDELVEIVQIQSCHLPGYNAAVASSLREGPMRGLSSSFSSLSELGFEVLLIWGTEDHVVPHKYASRLQSLMPKAELLTIEGAGHDLTVSHPDIIRKALVQFFRRPVKSSE